MIFVVVTVFVGVYYMMMMICNDLMCT